MQIIQAVASQHENLPRLYRVFPLALPRAIWTGHLASLSPVPVVEMRELDQVTSVSLSGITCCGSKSGSGPDSKVKSGLFSGLLSIFFALIILLVPANTVIRSIQRKKDFSLR